MLYAKNTATLQSHIDESKEEKTDLEEHYEFWQSCLSLDHIIAASDDQFLILIQHTAFISSMLDAELRWYYVTVRVST